MAITRHPTLPTEDAPDGPPPRRSLLDETRIVLGPLRLAGASRTLARTPRGDERLAVLVPGWLAGDGSMTPLQRYLRVRGHDARTWGLGRNPSDVESTVERFERRLEALVEGTGGRPANLVGWSLGGVIARETARERPDLAHRLVTIGTPAQGGPSFTAGAARFGVDECERIAAIQDEANRSHPLTVPTTAIFSRRDGVVNWKACLDPWATDIEHVEVTSTHLALGIDPDVWLLTAEALAEPESTA